MKIQRLVNGQVMEFELTSDELFSAFQEQEHLFDIQDVKNKFEGEMDPGEFEEEYGIPLELVLNNSDLLEEMADEKRRNQDKYDMDWEYARDDAIKDVIGKHLEELNAAAENMEAKNQNSEPHPSLPETCYGILAGAGGVIIIKKGETGYYKTDIDAGSNEANIELVDEFNAKAGITKAQRSAMENGSMFGWHVPAANPEMYDEDGKMKRPPLAHKIQAADDIKDEISPSIEARTSLREDR